MYELLSTIINSFPIYRLTTYCRTSALGTLINTNEKVDEGLTCSGSKVAILTIRSVHILLALTEVS